VCDLSKFVTDEILKSAFSKFGAVGSATVVRDSATGQSKRFGFVEMANDTEGAAAIQGLNHTKILKVKIRAKKAGTQKFTGTFTENKPPNAPAPAPAQYQFKARVSLDGRPIAPRPVVNPRPVYKGKPVTPHPTHLRREKSEFKPEYRKQHGPHRNEHTRDGFEKRDTFKLPDNHPFKVFSSGERRRRFNPK